MLAKSIGRKKKEKKYIPSSKLGKHLSESEIMELITPVMNLALRDPLETFYVGMELHSIKNHYDNKLKEQSLKLIIKASEGGISNASYILSLFYGYGAELGMVRRNGKKHVYYLNLAYEQDHDNVYALNLLAGKYGLGVDGFDKDSKKAFDYYKKASDLGFAYAQCNLSYFYLHGEVVEKDVEKALELLENAAEAGDTTAMYDLWYLYSGQNEDVEKDIEKSNYWGNKYDNRYRPR